MLSAILAVLLQVGPNPSAQPITAVPVELDEMRRRQRDQQQEGESVILPQSGKLDSCLERAEADTAAARIEAEAWLAGAVGITRSQALQCRGYAEANLGLWGDAAETFLTARGEDAAATDPKYRARLSAMAANALLTAGNTERALEVLDIAQADATNSGFTALMGEISIDRARALVALGENDQAAEALSAARSALPYSARAWLLSATLARRVGDLATAQSFIETASSLEQRSAEIGLEAGVIAVLSGQDEAARRSWQSVIDLAPQSAEAQTAGNYLRQLDNQ
ncbi:hypothetical protein GCM10023115_05920 [Pontixanthobacter gangjinensis]|uniref:Uncharacterized protein n=1 Tax=Pontixanthobacter gangjinensis TaxID=1028742 RepID=A0A6I4SJ14_9SPHN|nr:hypothetical protein [Pontixanthobacter gangjinensis]MXO55841.1 hypothetical protein [Pontixanthobacter gangjinensis]